MANQYLNFAKEVLAGINTPLTFNEIWETGVKNGATKKLTIKGKTPWNSLGANLYVDARDNKNSDFIKVGSWPTRFFLKSRSQELKNKKFDAIDIKITSTDKTTYSERDLHTILTYYAYSNLGFNRGKPVVTKTIFHEKSKKPGLAEWIFPDVVGFYMPVEEWSNEIVELNSKSDNNALKLFSFELKKELNRSNYRESYFQAVSNSSWAHEGFLVTAKLLEDDDLLSELDRLNQSFGIGIIQLDIEDADSPYQVLFQSKPKPFLDWETMNKLAKLNPEFKKFIQDIKIDLESKRIHLSEYDKVSDDIEGYIKRISK